jgi:hypothetical protein
LDAHKPPFEFVSISEPDPSFRPLARRSPCPRGEGTIRPAASRAILQPDAKARSYPAAERTRPHPGTGRTAQGMGRPLALWLGNAPPVGPDEKPEIQPAGRRG